MGYFVKVPKAHFYLSLGVFILSSTTYATLIIDTGKTVSPFIALWSLVGVFSGIFGLWGILPIFLATAVFIASEYINNRFTGTSVAVTVFCAVLPLIASCFIWLGGSKEQTKKGQKPTLDLELNEVASKSEVVINAIGDGVVAIDSKGTILLINPAAQNLLGWSEADAINLSYKSVLKLVDQKDEPVTDATDPIQEVLNKNQEVRNNKLTLLTHTGKKMSVSLVISPVGDFGSGVIVVFRDITKEKAAEREQAEFISTTSHEMRTPVASIEGYLGLALNPQTSQIDDKAREFITKAHESAGHLGRLFQDLLDISKSEDGRMTNNPKVTDIVPFIHDIVQGLRQKAIDKGLVISYKPMPDDQNVRFVAPAYSVNLDNDHIREIMENLIENAIKYTARGEIVIDIDADEEHVKISVKDSGIGIPAEDIPHLFQKFYRVDNKDTREIGGTGLGLFLSRKLAEMLGGRIWVESEYGKGSTFYLELPRISSQDAERLKEQEVLTAKIEAVHNPGSTVQLPTGALTSPKVMEPVVNKVPRGEALTPQQKEALVAKQRALAQQVAATQAAAPTPNTSQQIRPQNVTIPPRVLR